ncbi:MAG: cell wall hydrolase, partial [Brevundimonas sp. 12-68-7]
MHLHPVKVVDWLRDQLPGRRLLAAAPAALAALGVAMAASSGVRPEVERTAEAIARLTGGDMSARGLAILSGRMDAAQLAVATRFDPNDPQAAPLGLTPGWESLTLAGKPGFELGASGRDAQRLNAAMPAAMGALRPARPFVFDPATPADRARALRCLTQGIYYEAALESTKGQEAVAQVILNRVRDPNYANSVCGVVFEGAERVTGCQFSFTCDGSLSQQPVAWAWNRARVVAERALAGHVAADVGTATHYHADY